VLGETWENQYKRLHRSYARLQRVADQNTRDEELQQEDAARDVLYHFCSDALNLRDWIANSTNLSQQIRDDVYHLFDVTNHPGTASTALAACADISNGSKHFVLTRRPYTPGGPAKVTSQTQGARFPMTFPFHFGAFHFTIDVGGVDQNGLDVARRAVGDWDTWLTGHGLSLPK
jgi:hypothetical protein